MPSNQPHIPERSFGKDFKTFFLRGLAIVLPTALTIWLLVIAYQFVNQNIAGPINSGVRAAVIQFSNWPEPQDKDFVEIFDDLPKIRQDDWEITELDRIEKELGLNNLPGSVQRTKRLEWMKSQDDIVFEARLHAFEEQWDSIRVGDFRVLNLIGIVLAIILIYIAGVLVTSFIGRRFYRMGENLISRVPLVRSVYPAVKQVTDFFFSDDPDEKIDFNRVVAVQYPRKGLWSVGLVTGDTMQLIETTAGQPCLTVFVPSSPTPFTGYVITVPKVDTIDLPITVEEALKFAVSGGVVIPQNQVIKRAGAEQMVLPGTEAEAEESPTSAAD
ncbi:DUF502 domain-containing protein [Algisphaera agarilytica]|uniref:Putative membrane protein n=1 Tax=Algisphaera agarilytica TaxID=1385975 RepID=A0A7X0LK85_9BACT|nr:DUF502 domain-containing protein [Algisphaera agarilytica]MBB6428688.1 putative membrane protein [Algisphaera agarilytica]